MKNLIFVFVLSFPMTAIAGERLTSDELKALYTDKTIEGSLAGQSTIARPGHPLARPVGVHVIPAKAGIQWFTVHGFPPSRE